MARYGAQRMANKSIQLTDELQDYLQALGVRESKALAALREETSKLPAAVMQIGPVQAQFMALLIRLCGAKRCLEVGCFTGYSAMACAEALADDGHITTLDISEQWTDIAQSHWRSAGLDSRIELRLGPADRSMTQLLAELGPGSFDFVFIDADKTNYQTYYEFGLELLKPGGLVLVDNVLWGGAVLELRHSDADTRAISAFNTALSRDQRVDIVMLPVGDGLTLARKRH